MITTTNPKLSQLSRFLDFIAQLLDLTEAQYEEAVKRYEAVGAFLNEKDSLLSPFSPQIHPQGSFALGTVIRPLTNAEEFDIDLTLMLLLSQDQVTQQELKAMVGKRLRENAMYRKMLAPERRRCWRLDYAESTRFHLDIVPAIPDPYSANILRLWDVLEEYGRTAICITDNKTWDTDPEWPRCNPKGYAAWFKDQMLVQYKETRLRIMHEMRAGKVEDVPEYKIKTPLQRAIQVLKRHRDLRFEGDEELKPISIILTTLAAQAYRNETNIYDALVNILDNMPKYIEKRGEELWIQNPVDPRENFADKWNENPTKAKVFYEWIGQAKEDFAGFLNGKGLDEIASRANAMFGNRIVNGAMNRFGEELRNIQESTGLGVTRDGRLNQAAPILVPRHTFSSGMQKGTSDGILSNPISVEAQAQELQRMFHTAEITECSSTKLVCWLRLRPLEIGKDYLVRIIYALGQPPKVYVEQPRILHNGRQIPHLYTDNSLCLYHPENREWHPDMYIWETTVPWTVEWLAHYEIWAVTGQWNGGGH